MHRFASFNRQAVDPSEPALAAAASAAIYGKGVFTTIAIFDRQPFLWEKHWRRLEANALYMGIDLSDFREDVTVHALDELLRENKVDIGRARITFFDETASELWPFPSKQRTSLLITTDVLRSGQQNPKLTVSPYQLNSASPLAGVKSCNYLDKIIAREEAKRRCFEEAMQLNERGEIASACMANVFWLNNGKLFTPALATGCLAGTTREFVLENLECEEVEVGIDELHAADEIFLTSAGQGVAQVASFDGKELERAAHPIMDLLPLRG